MIFINEHVVFSGGRRNGKYIFQHRMRKALYSIKYRPFKEFAKEVRGLHIAYDLSNGKDWSVKTTAKRQNSITTIIKVEVVT